jgi:hypothetical protein
MPPSIRSPLTKAHIMSETDRQAAGDGAEVDQRRHGNVDGLSDLPQQSGDGLVQQTSTLGALSRLAAVSFAP